MQSYPNIQRVSERARGLYVEALAAKIEASKAG